MKRILLFGLDNALTDQIMNQLGSCDCIVIRSQMIPSENLWQAVIECQVHVAVAAQSELVKAKAHLWTFTKGLAVENYDFFNGGVDSLVADIIKLPASIMGGIPGECILSVGDMKVLKMEAPEWSAKKRKAIISELGVLRATGLMRETNIRKYHELAARYLDRVTNHRTIARLPTGARFAALRGCLARALGSLAQFNPACDPDSLPAAGTEIDGVIAIQPMITPQALYAVECIKRQVPGEKFPDACRHALINALPGGIEYPVEKQVAVLTQLCRLLLRVVSDLLLVLIDAPCVKVRQINQARTRLTAVLGLCFAEARWEDIEEATDQAGPMPAYEFGQFLASQSEDRAIESLGAEK